MKQRVLLSGSDVVDLLHRISTVNLQTLKEGEGTPALILTPQGKIACFFWVFKKSDSELEIEFDDRFLEMLDQYTFGEQYQITPIPLPPSSVENESTRIQNLVPRWGQEFKNDDSTNPLEVNLRSAIHDQKGCYPGQEVIEKIISLGSPARKLCLMKGSYSGSLPAPLIDPASQQEVGTLTSFIRTSDEEGYGLGIIRRTHLREGLELQNQNQFLTLIKVSL